MDIKEERINSIKKLYYSNPKVQEVLLKFSAGREVVPRYFESFGKRPDTLQYASDIMGLVNKGATSFHASEEIWEDPLKISSDMSSEELSENRKSWDLLIDVDSKYLDCSKVGARLILDTLEMYGIKNYGIKFSGSKGFHIIVPGRAFPEEHDGIETKKMFPEWPRSICEFLIEKIRPEYNKAISKLDINFEALKERTNLSKEDLAETICPECNKPVKKSKIVTFKCTRCGSTVVRPNFKPTKRELKCIEPTCPGKLEIIKEEDYFYCDNCKISSLNKQEEFTSKKVVYTRSVKESARNYSDEFEEGISGSKLASPDLVLVAPRHLFRMPYSLHEKTSLASAVISKQDLSSFTPKDANPLSVKILNFLPECIPGEAEKLLEDALKWKVGQSEGEYSNIKNIKKYINYKKIDVTGVREEMFPLPIKKLLRGLKDGKKRGLFVLITFLRSLNFTPEFINERIRKWNELNEPPLREGYIRSQIEWHLKQKKQILPPNYNNNSFYKDLNLLDHKPSAKNPIVEVIRKLKGNSY